MIDDYYDAESAMNFHTDHVLGGGPLVLLKKRSERSCPMIGGKRRYSPEGGVESMTKPKVNKRVGRGLDP